GWCAAWPGPTARSAGSSTVISMASSAWRCRRPTAWATARWAAGGAGDAGELLTGVKTFCSGAGGLDRALVLARDPDAPAPAAVWVDLTDPATVTVDEHWYRGAGMRASVSHRVIFDGAPILARFGGPGALSAQPWFGRDALRTAASWAGMADGAVDGALEAIAERPGSGPL